MSNQFTMLLPFSISAHAELDAPISAVIRNHDATVVAERGGYAVKVHGISSESGALVLLRQTATGLLWAGLELGFGIRVDPTPNEVKKLAAPSPPHSIRPGATAYADYGACVYPDGTEIALFRVFSPERIYTIPPVERIAELISEGARTPNAEHIWDHPRIPVAMSMFADSHFQSSSYAGFLACMNVLEILKQQVPRSEAAVDLVKSWKEELKSASHSAKVQVHEYEALSSALNNQTKTSIKQAIRQLVSAYLSDEEARKASNLYDLRSKLVHDGTVDDDSVAKGYSDAKELVRMLMRSMLERELEAST